MIEQKLQNYFKKYKAITPTADFAHRSLSQITCTVQLPAPTATWFMRFKETLTTGSAMALASLLLLILVGGISYVAKQSGQFATNISIGNDTLSREASLVTFNVQLENAQYFDESASQVARTLDRLSGNSQ